ncbi:hypothetical protein [Aestuariivivens sediminis]|uniref:hypothetical protein n=1 Tax=Aestuariivivens sediminis TaxID=2913557 RepID=UPI001F58A1FD|nr:hypothetical protein [Aestuariivivens sediminis]
MPIISSYRPSESKKTLNKITLGRGQNMFQLALAWVLRDHRVTSVTIGVSSVSPIEDAVGIQNNLEYTSEA